VPDGGCEPCEDGCPPDDCWPCVPPLDGLPLEPLLPPVLVCCGGNGDSLPLPDGLELGLLLELLLVPVLPPEVDGNGDGVAGDDDAGGCGNDGGDGACVDVLTAQPARPSAQATGQTRPRT
jgi:hypothetical protein